jgi:hypothetical protein
VQDGQARAEGVGGPVVQQRLVFRRGVPPRLAVVTAQPRQLRAVTQPEEDGMAVVVPLYQDWGVLVPPTDEDAKA